MSEAYKRKILSEEHLCICGCGNLKRRYDNQGRESKYIQGHNSKGENNNMYGKKRPDISLYNLSKKGFKHTEESKRKTSETLKGKYYIEITKKELNDLYVIKRLSLPQISKRTGFSICALHNALKRFNLPTLHNHPFGRIFSKETKIKLKILRAKRVLPVKDTSIEVKIQNYLKLLGVSFFTHQYIKEINHSYQCDIFIPAMDLIIECDGDYWHKYPVGNDIDHIRTKELIENGFKVLRLWEREIKAMSLNDFKKRLKK